MMNKVYDTEDVDRLTFTAPAGGVVSGKFYRIGRFFGAAVSSVPAGKPFTLDRKGAWRVKTEAQGNPIAIGDEIYWEAGRADAEFHNDGADAGGILVGHAYEAAAAGYQGELIVVIEPGNRAPIA